MSATPFRFGVQSYSATSGADWREQARTAESLGYSALHLADHVIGPGPALAATNHPVQNLSPVPAMAVAAEATTTLKVGCRVFCTDYRNPVMLAKDLATFPDFAHHVEWLARGSDGFKAIGSYGATNRPVAGGMPAWAAQLTAKQLLAVAYYERIHFGGQTEADLKQLKTLAENPALPASFPLTLTLEDVEKLIADLAPATG